MAVDSPLRLFVAVAIPDHARAALRDTAYPVIAATPSVRWVRPESLHCTLVFLGDRSPEAATHVVAVLRAACTGTAPFELLLAGPGCFPSAQRPRVLWFGFTVCAALVALQRSVQSGLVGAGLLVPGERFSPHLTLGRLREAMHADEPAAIGRAWLALRAPECPPIPVAAISLMRSDLERGGARYTELERFPLAGH